MQYNIQKKAGNLVMIMMYTAHHQKKQGKQ